MGWKPLPIGVESFEELLTKGYYFVDKTLFIRALLNMKGEVNLFTRPCRFGKTLNMSMLRYFFELNEDNRALFEGTYSINHIITNILNNIISNINRTRLKFLSK